MKTIIRETSDSLIDFYLGKTVVIHGAIFHYSGEVVAIDKDFLKLEKAVVVLDSSVDESGFKASKTFKKGAGVVLVGREMIEAIYEL